MADARRLIDWLAKRPEVRLDGQGDPRVGVAGASYGGAISLLAAGYDRRVDAIAPEITYWNLADALFPNGVYKKLWAGLFFTTGSADLSQAQGDQEDANGGGGAGGGMGQSGAGGANGGAGQGVRADPGKNGTGDESGGKTLSGCSPRLVRMERVAVPRVGPDRRLEARSPS
ncbi:ABC transporter domain-containing protein OS=Streptomyces antimycoticus OX=68175 GN=SANT12839_087470 PE=4 SV=1 [Streptomyces antimycoticus]